MGSSDIERSKIFYDAIMGVIGCAPGEISPDRRLRYFHKGAMLTLLPPINGHKPDPGNGHTLGLAMDSIAMTNRWHEEGVKNGGTAIEDPPGIRKRPFGDIYLAYLRDPDGNKLCAKYDIPAE
jgi:catechol 2,3-dioxygenase-like lactoylglutathione lyase family enzyme